jgi:hypothetical protein
LKKIPINGKIRKTNAGNVFTPTKVIYRFSAIPIKMPILCFTGIGKKSTIHIKTQKNMNRQSNLEKTKQR